MAFSHTIRIWKTTTTGGGFGEDPVVTEDERYDGRCDVQDLSYEIKRGLSGDEELMGDARVFFPRGSMPTDVSIDDDAQAVFEGVTFSGRVVDIDRLDETVVVKWQS